MSNLTSSADKAQMIELLNSIKLPIMGAGGGFAPIGTINFFDASVAPVGWLACDGTVYNIADYPDLATYYASVHGSVNFYGGNGTTTFAVPDLRGEFLRGTGTNSHTNQGDGANVGVHQDATTMFDMTLSYGNSDFGIRAGDDKVIQNTDSEYKSYSGTLTYNSVSVSKQSTSGQSKDTITSRPTNTSFLICVKATVSGDANAHQYSTEEQVVGTWIDGKILYERTIDLGVVSANDGNNRTIQIPNVDMIMKVSFVAIRTEDNRAISEYFRNSNDQITLRVMKDPSDTYPMESCTASSALSHRYCTLRYTKTS